MGAGAPARMLSEAVRGASKADVRAAVASLSKEDRAMIKMVLAEEEKKESSLEAVMHAHAPIETASDSKDKADLATDAMPKTCELASIAVTSLAGELRDIDGVSPNDTLIALRSKVALAFGVQGTSHVELMMGTHKFADGSYHMSLEMLGVWNDDGPSDLQCLFSPMVRLEDFSVQVREGIYVTHLPTDSTISLESTSGSGARYEENKYKKPEITLEESGDPCMLRVALKYTHVYERWDTPPRHITASLEDIQITEKACYIVLRHGKIRISEFGKDDARSGWVLDGKQ
eukprot:TRINITY_DN20334_c0_g1_i1.p1 TRINITY_DN20334_c0_g1~~TRINITY_DN20334_c0_g1_i1.p1  ORF type:complete len:288 (+),score=40.32 TRINITY_DN20334_c0_g1_i1:56-919(+)